MKTTYALFTAASVTLGGIALVGCKSDNPKPRTDATVTETRDGTVIATDGKAVTAVRTSAPRGDKAAERMGIFPEDVPTAGRSGADVDSTAPGADKAGEDRMNPMAKQRGSTADNGLPARGEDPRAPGNDRNGGGDANDGMTNDQSTVGVGSQRVPGTTGGVVVPYNDNNNVIIRDGTSGTRVNDGQNGNTNTGDTNQGTGNANTGNANTGNANADNQTPDPGAPGSISGTANPDGKTGSQPADPGAAGSVTSTPNAGGGGAGTGGGNTGGGNAGGGGGTGQ